MTPSSLHNLYHRTKKKFLDLSSSKRLGLLSVTIAVCLLVITAPQITNAGFLDSIIDPTQMFAWVGSGVLWVMAGIMGIAAVLLNVTILQTVLGMGNHINDIIGIQVAWSLLRDIANIIFIFSIVYIGLSLILGINRHGHQQALARLVIIALIINFSLFLTKAVVETSNIMSTQIFRLIIPTTLTTGGPGCNPNDPSPEGTRNCINYGLTGIINNSLGLSTVFDVAGTTTGGGFSGEQKPGIDSAKVFYITVLGSIFLLITAFVFASAAVLLVIRFVILIMLMVFSPLAFAAWILPSTSGYFSFWLKSLLNQSFFAPAYMLMMWMAIKIIEGFGVSTVTGVASTGNNFGAALTGANVSFATVFLNFAIITVFMVAALVVAKKFGAIGADKAYSIGKGWVNKAQSTAYKYARKPVDYTAALAWKNKGKVAAGAAGAAFLPGLVGVGGALAGVAGATTGVAGWLGAKRGVKYVGIESGRKIAEKVNSWNERSMKKPRQEGGVADNIRKATIGRVDNAFGYSQTVATDVKSAQEKIKLLSRDGNFAGISDFIKAQRPDVGDQLFAALPSSDQIKVAALMGKIVKNKRDGTVNAKKTERSIEIKTRVLANLRESAREKYLESMAKDFANDASELYKQISTLGGKDLEYAYSKMTPRIRAVYEGELKKQPDGDARIIELRKKISIEDQEKTGKEAKEAKERSDKRSRKGVLNDLIQQRQVASTADVVQSPTAQENLANLDLRINNTMRVMGDKEAAELNPDTLRNESFARHVTASMLAKIGAADSIPQETKKTLKDNVVIVGNPKAKEWIQKDINKGLFE